MIVVTCLRNMPSAEDYIVVREVESPAKTWGKSGVRSAACTTVKRKQTDTSRNDAVGVRKKIAECRTGTHVEGPEMVRHKKRRLFQFIALARLGDSWPPPPDSALQPCTLLVEAVAAVAATTIH